MSRVECYTDDWQRTEPDYVVYLPKQPGGRDEYADHIHVFETPGGEMMAMWTQGAYESSPDTRMVFARSSDGGHSWSNMEVLAEPKAPTLCPSLGFPLVSRSGRIYCLYIQSVGCRSGGFDDIFSGVMRGKYSDDDGHTWVDGRADIPVRRTRFDHPDPKIDPTWIVWQQPIRDAEDRMIVGWSRWSSQYVYPRPMGGNRYHLDSACELMRFDNVDEGPDPADLKITWLPDEVGTIRVSCGIEPDASRGYSLAEEPGIVLLPDGRLCMNMRTVTGRIWYTVSEDHGHSWRAPEVLRFRDDGDEVLHPKSPAPIYRLGDGRYLLFFHNHDGYGHGATGPWDMEARRPEYITVGEFRPGAHQPIWFSEPKFLFDSQGVICGATALKMLAMYSSLTERDGERVFWYADRKQFVVGKRITDEMLGDMQAPE